MVNTSGFNSKNKKEISYPDIPSARRPIPHSEFLPVPLPKVLDRANSDSSSSGKSDSDDIYEPDHADTPQLFEQAELNDLVRDLGLSKISAELLGSRLQAKNLLSAGATFAWYRCREKNSCSTSPKMIHLCFVITLQD